MCQTACLLHVHSHQHADHYKHTQEAGLRSDWWKREAYLAPRPSLQTETNQPTPLCKHAALKHAAGPDQPPARSPLDGIKPDTDQSQPRPHLPRQNCSFNWKHT